MQYEQAQPETNRNGINKLMKYSAYIHIPFCEHRCHYCDFNTTTGLKAVIPDYLSAVGREISIVSAKTQPLTLHSIYFGGGTPSLVPAQHYEKLMNIIFDRFAITGDCEITLEANPGTLTNQYLSDLRSLGINRISIGVQSTDTFDLIRLDRIHNIEDILNSVRYARLAGFNNISLDMIFSLPWQDLHGWQHSLSRAISLNPDHFSLYSLIVEPGTILYEWFQKGLVAPQDQDLEGDMYELAMDMLEDAGFEHYEISNWAKRDPITGFQSQHNKQYWKNQPYLGFGAGAHGYAANKRTINVTEISEYIRLVNHHRTNDDPFPISPATISVESVDLQTQMKDFMMLGLRLVEEGVSAEDFKSRYGFSVLEVFDREIQSLMDRKLIEWIEGKMRLRLSERGMMIANQVFMEFV